jgi:hypothetical protein
MNTQALEATAKAMVANSRGLLAMRWEEADKSRSSADRSMLSRQKPQV